MKRLLRFLAFILMVGGAYAQSKLPACRGLDTSRWNICLGTHSFSSGEKYVGEFKNGKRNGQGTYTFANGDQYVGEYKDDEQNGQGTYTFANGEKYVGDYKDGKRNGQGTYTQANGEKYVGDFKDGKRNGQFVTTFANGDQYVGEYKDDKRHGQGTLYSSSGAVINQGIWADGNFVRSAQLQQASVTNQLASTPSVEPNAAISNLPACKGKEIARWSNCLGEITKEGQYFYIGGFLNGLFQSFGTMKVLAPNFKGDEYVGEFKGGKFEGQGTYTQANGAKYVGEFKDGKRHGQGTFTLANGDKHVGEYKDGKRNGQGTYTFANGNKYVGEFKDSHYNGQGTLYSSNGSVINQGIWVNGNFVNSAPVQQVTAPSKPNSKERDRLAALSKLPACPATGYLNNCFGTYAFPSGELYIGEFRNNLRHGQGTFYTSSGLVVSEGLWSDGKLVRQSSVQLAISQTDQSSSTERDRFNAEIEVERKKRQELEQQLAASKERERITAELDLERKKRQELEAQLAASPQQSYPQSITPRRVAHALVIGNGAYPGSGRLDNPVNDANAISQKLRSMGFTVTTVTDANRQRLVQSMAQFRRTAASADISLLYYAGHGVQIFGTNYILPTDVDQTDPAQATIQGVSLNSVVENFLPGKTKLVFLDACRDNALQRTNDRSVSKGLAPISAAEGTLISYATKDGQTAADGVGSKNSPFTQALLEHLNDPQDIAVVLRKVRERVMKITGGKQQPWEYGSLTGGELVLSAIKPK